MSGSKSEGEAGGDRPRLELVGRGGGRIWGMDTAERLRRQFADAGVDVAAPAVTAEEGATPGGVILVRADAVLDPPLIAALVARPGLVLMADNVEGPIAGHARDAAEARLVREALASGETAGLAEGGLAVRRPGELGVNFWKKLRKREAPYALVLNAANRREVEWRSFMGTYKGATDLVTKRLWPRPAFHVTRWLAETPVTPNMVTLASAVLVVVAFWLFWTGNYGWGLASAWLMTFLDTVDGKLARTTLKTSRWGDVFDHGIDLLHPPFWYWAWLEGLDDYGLPLDAATWRLVLAVIVGGYVLQRLVEGAAIAWLGMEIHIWRRFDTFFREITARRNPNLVILTLFALLERPDLGIGAVAWWTVISLLVHLVQIFQAMSTKMRRGELVSWMAEEGSEKGDGT